MNTPRRPRTSPRYGACILIALAVALPCVGIPSLSIWNDIKDTRELTVLYRRGQETIWRQLYGYDWRDGRYGYTAIPTMPAPEPRR